MKKRNIILIIFALFVVRDVAVRYEMNHHALLATYDLLHHAGIINSNEGMGYLLTENTVEKIREKEKKEFIANDLPELRRKIELLRLNDQDMSDLMNLIKSNSK